MRLTNDHLGSLKQQIDQRLMQLGSADADDDGLVAQAMRHALTSPGKRFRPIVALLTAEQFGGDRTKAVDPACAVEMVHAASLILDDLPSMDDAALRRGAPTTHRLFGEDMAILAAIALLMQAFSVVTEADGLTSDTKLAITATLARATGLRGLVGGQEIDLRGRSRLNDLASLRDLNRRKTGALIVAAVDIGLHVAVVDGTRAATMRVAADHIGEAFQTVDDLLDATAEQGDIGKDVLQDRNKPTLITIAGLAEARQAAKHHMDRAASLITDCSPSSQTLIPYLRTVFDPHLNV